MNETQKAIERFSKDLFATKATGIKIEEVHEGYAKCSLEINEDHLNAEGYVMGGAIYTLADFAFAVGANCGNATTVTTSSHISYIRAAKGPILYGEAKRLKNSRNICFYEIEVHDGEDNLVAKVTATGFRRG